MVRAVSTTATPLTNQPCSANLELSAKLPGLWRLWRPGIPSRVADTILSVFAV